MLNYGESETRKQNPILERLEFVEKRLQELGETQKRCVEKLQVIDGIIGIVGVSEKGA